jgi:hypothetical protein
MPARGWLRKHGGSGTYDARRRGKSREEYWAAERINAMILASKLILITLAIIASLWFLQVVT